MFSNKLKHMEQETKEIKIALENVKRGKIKPIEQIAKELNIELT